MLALACVVAAGCDGAKERPDVALACLSATDALAGESNHGFAEPVAIESSAPARSGGGTRIIYLDRYARGFVAGRDDAQAGASSVLASQHLDHVTLGGFQQGDDTWAAVVTCIRAQYARYDVAVTDIRPVTPGYVEAHFGGTGREVGLADGAGGIAPIDSTGCGVVEGAPVFVFSDLFGKNVRSLCEVGAHEIAHTFTLDHEYDCKDPMTYITGCGDKTFQQAPAPCGEGGARPCLCNRPSQSSVIVLRELLGDRASDTVPPTVELLPLVADPSGTGTRVQIRAHDPGGALKAIELHRVSTAETGMPEEVITCGDGLLPCTLDGELASFDVPPAPADSQVWAVAEDTAGNRTSTPQATLVANPVGMAALTVVVAPLALAYAPDGVVELQALVLAQQPLVEMTVVWTDPHGAVHELPMCRLGGPSDPLGEALEGRWGVAIHLGASSEPRHFHVRATDVSGTGAQSADEVVSVAR